ncbi:hypothetical protein L2E82_13213 [Cichorium intybus]|uniref:Uncharacterized protein n=1 Tax=Cichorium intybus TaxID=13427 RepID=A0ACB9GHZ6_CICIN|nr:hypothetical protein L2E82_13213 [Cichorium intybus]
MCCMSLLVYVLAVLAIFCRSIQVSNRDNTKSGPYSLLNSYMVYESVEDKPFYLTLTSQLHILKDRAKRIATFLFDIELT